MHVLSIVGKYFVIIHILHLEDRIDLSDPAHAIKWNSIHICKGMLLSFIFSEDSLCDYLLIASEAH